MDNENLLNEKQAAKVLTVGTRVLQSWRVRGFGPTFLKLGRLIRYKQSAIDSWIEGQVRQSTSDKGEG